MRGTYFFGILEKYVDHALVADFRKNIPQARIYRIFGFSRRFPFLEACHHRDEAADRIFHHSKDIAISYMIESSESDKDGLVKKVDICGKQYRLFP